MPAVFTWPALSTWVAYTTIIGVILALTRVRVLGTRPAQMDWLP